MSYHLGIDDGDKRIYDQIAEVSDEEFCSIIDSKELPDIYCVNAIHYILEKHPDTNLSEVKISIRKDGEGVVLLDKTDLSSFDIKRL